MQCVRARSGLATHTSSSRYFVMTTDRTGPDRTGQASRATLFDADRQTHQYVMKPVSRWRHVLIHCLDRESLPRVAFGPTTTHTARDSRNQSDRWQLHDGVTLNKHSSVQYNIHLHVLVYLFSFLLLCCYESAIATVLLGIKMPVTYFTSSVNIAIDDLHKTHYRNGKLRSQL